MKIARRTFLAAVAAISALACGTGRSSTTTDSPQQKTTVLVDNQGFLDVTVYLISGAQHVRLGIANGNSKTRLTIPPHYIFGPTPLQFLAAPIGGSSRTPRSDTITVIPGDEVTLTIPPWT